MIARLLAPLGHLRGRLVRLLGAQTVGVRALVMRDDDHVLLIRHTYRSGWHTPGGGVRQGETPVEAIRREVLEETGLSIEGEPVLFGAYHHRWQGADDYPLLYVVRAVSGEAITRDPLEIAEVGWFPLSGLPAETTAKTRARIAEWQAGGPSTDRW